MMKRYITILICISLYISMIFIFNNIIDEKHHFISNVNNQGVLSSKASAADRKKSSIKLEKDDLLKELTIRILGMEKNADIHVRVNNIDMEARKSLGENPYLVFQCKKCSLGFKNNITINNRLIHVFDMKTSKYKTLKVPISYKLFNCDVDNIITINSGVREDETYYNDNKKMDRFYIKNVRLVFSDGTEIYDNRYKDVDIAMGSGKSRKKSVSFNFRLPAERFKKRTVTVSYGAINQGKNTIKIIAGNKVIRDKFIFDSESPIIKKKFNTENTYMDRIKIDFSIKDKTSQVKKIKVKLDNREISLPYEDLASRLKPGKHTVKVTAEDMYGNKAVEYYFLNTSREKYEVNIKANKHLRDVIIGESPQEKYNVYVYKGEKCNCKFIDIYGADMNTKPIHLNNEEEKLFLPNDQELIQKVDNRYLEKKSKYNLPYEKFDIKTNKRDLSSQIKITWKGHVDDCQRLTMYGWNIKSSKWIALKSILSENKDIELSTLIPGEEYIDKNCIHVLVQSGDSTVLRGKCRDFTFAWMTDTQYYSKKYKNIYEIITKWIADNNRKIQYVIHSGDLVDNYNDINQWSTADSCMRILESANIPYGVLPGNHDVNHERENLKFYTNYFGTQRFLNSPVYRESYKNNKGHYDVATIGGNDFIIVYMGWGIKDKEIAWINEVLAKNREKKAILVFHEYMFEYGSRTPTGNAIFKNVIMPNSNVFAVLCGHFHESRLLVDGVDDDGDGDADRKVYQMLADYQDGPKGGQGYIRLLKFNCRSNVLEVSTYSPYLKKKNYYDEEKYPLKDSFSIDMNLKPMKKTVATDYLGADIYTDVLLEEYKDVKGGNVIHIDGKKLSSQNGGYYIITEDSSGKRTVTEVYNN